MNRPIHQDTTLRPIGWAFDRYGYTKERRSAFWQWAKANGLPFVKLSARKAGVIPAECLAWEGRRTVGRGAS